MTNYSDETDELKGGRWVQHGYIMRWEPTPKRRRLPRLVPDKLGLIACPTCYARVDQACTNPGGGQRIPHPDRLVGRRCPCGATVEGRKRYCETCRVESIKASRREYARRRHQKVAGRGDVAA